jgi:hypothetical protein
MVLNAEVERHRAIGPIPGRGIRAQRIRVINGLWVLTGIRVIVRARSVTQCPMSRLAADGDQLLVPIQAWLRSSAKGCGGDISLSGTVDFGSAVSAHRIPVGGCTRPSGSSSASSTAHPQARSTHCTSSRRTGTSGSGRSPPTWSSGRSTPERRDRTAGPSSGHRLEQRFRSCLPCHQPPPLPNLRSRVSRLTCQECRSCMTRLD